MREGAALREAARLLRPLVNQGEDYIWRPASTALAAIESALVEMERPVTKAVPPLPEPLGHAYRYFDLTRFNRRNRPMTISISVSVNGNYKAPVKVTRQDGSEENHVVSGYGMDRPNVLSIPFYHHTGNIVTMTVGPEEQDNGD